MHVELLMAEPEGDPAVWVVDHLRAHDFPAEADRLALRPGGDQVRDLASEAGMPMSYVVITDDRAA